MPQPPEARPFDTETLTKLSSIARLRLDAGQQAAVLPILQATYDLIDKLDAVELGEAFPATAFDLRPR